MRALRGLLVPVIATTVIAALPAAASAGTASVNKDGQVSFTANDGEANDLYVAPTDGGFKLTDLGAPIALGPGCTRETASKVLCTGVHVVARLGDQDDRGTGAAGFYGLELDGGEGGDRLTSASTSASLRGGAGDDDLTCGNAVCHMHGGFGADYMRGYTEAGRIGGQGDVVYTDRTVGVRVTVDGIADDGNANDGPVGDRDNVVAVNGVYGGAGNDVLYDGPSAPEDRSDLGGLGGNDDLHGLAGKDIMMGGPGTDRLYGGAGSDSLYPDGVHGSRLDVRPGSGDLISGGDDHDFLTYARAASVYVSLNSDADDGASGEGDNVLADVEDVSMTGTGNDVLVGSDADDHFHGGVGDDDISGGGGVDAIWGDNGEDRLSGGPGSDYLTGDVGFGQGPPDADILDGGTGDDSLDGNAGDDLLDGGAGADRFYGGPGRDTASYVARTSPVVATLAGGGANDGVDTDADGVANERDDLGAQIENLHGGAGRDHLTGNAAGNELVGGGGADGLEGLEGSDVLDGGLGGDTLEGGTDNDRILQGKDPDGPDAVVGGTGVDTVDYSRRPLAVAVSLDGVPDDGRRFGGEGDNVRPDVEVVLGGVGADLLTGAPIDNRLDGGTGDDVLDGGFGADDLVGGTGEDTVTYATRTGPVTADLDGAPDDGTTADANSAGDRDRVRSDIERLIGGTGADRLTGNAFANQLTGGGGPDILTGGGAIDFLYGGDGDDDLFSRGDGAADTAACQGGTADEVTADAGDTVSGCEIAN